MKALLWDHYRVKIAKCSLFTTEKRKSHIQIQRERMGERVTVRKRDGEK